jgi:opacity protein-like surface antigen
MKKVLLSAVIMGATMSSAYAIEDSFVGIGYNIDSAKYKEAGYTIEEPAASSLNLSYGYNVNNYIGLEVKALIGLTGSESGSYSATCDSASQPFIKDQDGNDTADQVPCGTTQVDQVKLNSQIGLNLRLGFPVAKNVILLGKAGIAYSDFNITKKEYDKGTGGLVDGGVNEKTNISGTHNTYGLGLGFNMNSGGQVELMYNMNYDDNDLKYTGVQLGYNFNF